MATKQTEIESKYGKPLEQVLVELYEQHGNVKVVARELNITPGMVSYFVRACGLCFRTVLVRRTAYQLTPKGEDYVRSMHSESSQGLDNVAMAVAVGD